ncbi:MAG: helicase HerA-like domain-containing protein [Pseudomonadota bacterium]
MDAPLMLGRRLDGGREFRLDPALLRTHGVVVGMTGSGKTGLSLVLIEEAVRAGVPVIALDPKGDLSNLGLLFRDLAPAQAAPWSGEQDPAEVCSRWREGLARWGLGATDVAALADKLALSVWTPGSGAGLPVDVVGCFQRPPPAVLGQDEARHALVADLVGGLLGLVGRKADPLRDPAHVVLSQVLDRAWLAGRDPDLPSLILALLEPPFDTVGVLPLDRFFPPAARMDLAVALNAVVAAPGFAAWSHGAPLDIEALLAPAARTSVHVFHLAHLEEAERQFFVSLLLGRVRAWSRAQPGTERLRALLLFDEVSGYLPPHPANPPAKASLLGLMKQARAVGLGVLLATQNPVDLDYKALSNAGLWCIGRLSTRQDRDRLLTGLAWPGLDSAVAGLEKRSFLVVQPGREEPCVVQSRHSLCWLRGPFTALEIERLVAEIGGHAPAPETPAPPAGTAPIAAPATVTPEGLLEVPPPAPGPVAFLDPAVAFGARLAPSLGVMAEAARPDGLLVHRPALLAELALTFQEKKAGFVLEESLQRCLFPLGEAGQGEPVAVPFADGDLCAEPPPGSLFHRLPAWIDEERELLDLGRRLVQRVQREATRGLLSNPALKLWGQAGEPREGFEARARALVLQRVDDATGKLEERYAERARKLRERIAAKEASLADQQGALRAHRIEEAVNVGETLLSFLGGRKRSLSTAVRKRRQTTKTRGRMGQIEDEIGRLRGDLTALEAELSEKLAAVRAEQERALEATVEVPIRLGPRDVRLTGFGIVWVPVTRRT